MRHKFAATLPVREVFARFWPYTRPFRGRLGLGIGLGLCLPVLQAATIWMFKILVDRVLVPADLGALAPIGAFYLVIVVIAGIVSFADSYLSRWLAQHFVLNLRTHLFTHLLDLSPDELEKRPLGDVLSRLGGDARAIEQLVVSGVTRSLGNILRVVLFGAALLWLRWELALVALAVLPAFGIAAKFFAVRIKALSREARHHAGVMTAVSAESLGNAPLVQAYQRQNAEIARFREAGHRCLDTRLAAVRLGAAFAPLVTVLELTGVLAVVALGTWEMAAGQFTLGALFAFLGYMSQLFGPVRALSRLTNTIYAASAGAERIDELLAIRPSVRERPDAVAIGRATGVIELDDVGFTYPGAARPALQAVSVRAEPGQVLALVGASGAGKSTVTKLIMRLYDAASGSVRLDGHDVRDLTLASLRANIAVVLQETLVFNGTIADNIAYGRPGATDDDVRRVARIADVDGFVRRMPAGYDTLIGERGRRLSGGQRQRIAIARALIRDAPVLILDEPTVGLDEDTKARLREPLRRLMAGRTTIVIAHDPRTVALADRVLHLEHGRPIEPLRHAAGAPT